MDDMSLSPSGPSKMRSPDRILELEVIDGTAPKKNIGMVDNSLFTGGNKLHVKMDMETTLWFFQYEHGVLPEPLKNKYTGFRKAKKFAEEYFKKRNIRIKEVHD